MVEGSILRNEEDQEYVNDSTALVLNLGFAQLFPGFRQSCGTLGFRRYFFQFPETDSGFWIIPIHTIIWSGKCQRKHVFPPKNLHRCDRLARSALRHLDRGFLLSYIFFEENFLSGVLWNGRRISKGSAGRKKVENRCSTESVVYDESEAKQQKTSIRAEPRLSRMQFF